MTGKLLLITLVLIGVLFLVFVIRRKFKSLSLPCVFFVSGAVKSGKTLLSVHLAIKEYKSALRWWNIKRWLVKIFLPFKYSSLYGVWEDWKASDYQSPISDNALDCGLFPPMLYSNIPLAYVRYNKLTIDIILANKRIPNKSVVLIDEISLFADSTLFKDRETNNKLLRWFKLYGHMSHGGKMIIDSQAIADNHFSLRRCMSNYLYIQERKKLPFISILYVREMIYSEDKSAINVVEEDLELSLRKVIIFNNTYNKYDCYCYSVFTDYLPFEVRYDTEIKTKHDSLKCANIVTLNDFVKEINESYYYHLHPEEMPKDEELEEVLEDEEKESE